MAFRTFRRRRFGRSRRTLRRRRRNPYDKMRKSGGATYHYIKVKNMTAESSGGTGLITSTMTVAGVSGAGNFASLADLYDAYEVCAMKFKLVPYNIGNESLATGDAGPGPTVSGNTRGNLISFCDFTGTAVATTIGTAVEYDTFKMHVSRHMSKRYIKIPKKFRPAMNDFSVGGTLGSGTYDSRIVFLGDNFNASSVQYWACRTWYLRCRAVR